MASGATPGATRGLREVDPALGNGAAGDAPMHDHPKGAGDGPAITTYDEDDREQAAILRQVLVHPATLTMDELVREMTGGGTRDFSDFDAVQRGVRELAGTGSLHRPGEDEMVHPTRAAVRQTLAGTVTFPFSDAMRIRSSPAVGVAPTRQRPGEDRGWNGVPAVTSMVTSTPNTSGPTCAGASRRDGRSRNPAHCENRIGQS